MFDKKDTVLILGVGRSGLATAEVLRGKGASVVAFDDKSASQLGTQAKALAALGVPLIGKGELATVATRATAAVLSPGMPLNNPSVRTVQEAGVPLYPEVEIAYRLSPAPIIAVTGTKGKSTTTALIGHLLRGAGMGVRIGGNIGNALIKETVAASADDWVVAEVSSFQLDSIRTFKPRISVLLNTTPDHLDRYPSMDEYVEAKYRIFANQGLGDAFVANADDEHCARLRTGESRGIPCPAFWFSTRREDADILASGGTIVWRGGRNAAKPATIISIADLRLRGEHNVANAMAAALVALLLDVPVEAIREGLRSFEGLPHRLQEVARIDGVLWIDDSKATNPDAAIKALDSFDESIVLIAGGRGKNTDFHELGRAASAKARAVVLIGESAREIGGGIEGPPVSYAAGLEEAVDAAARTAHPGDVVLLSPACASFDMFESAEERGLAFARLVRKRAKLVS